MNLNNIVIEVLNEEHGKNVINYWKSLGIDTDDYVGENTKEEGDELNFYGIINNVFSCYSYTEVIESGASIVTIPTPVKIDNTNNINNNQKYKVYILNSSNEKECKEFELLLNNGWEVINSCSHKTYKHADRADALYEYINVIEIVYVLKNIFL